MAIPTVTIGLPVHNGANFIRQAIESHLEQTLEDFTLVISDNASDDETPAICQEYATSDDRIVYVRREHNVGAAPNFNSTFESCSSPYFKWAAHDDVIAPEFLERCVAALENDTSAVLACSRIGRIDERGESVGIDDYRLRVTSPRVAVRFHDLACRRHSCFQIFGVIRRDVLARTPLIQNFPGSDRNLLAELALHGRFHVIDDMLFERRVHARSYSVSRMSHPERRRWWFGSDAADDSPSSRRVRTTHLLESVGRAPLDDRERRACTRVARIDYPASRLTRIVERQGARVKRRLTRWKR